MSEFILFNEQNLQKQGKIDAGMFKTIFNMRKNNFSTKLRRIWTLIHIKDVFETKKTKKLMIIYKLNKSIARQPE